MGYFTVFVKFVAEVHGFEGREHGFELGVQSA